MSREEIEAFLMSGTRTGKVSTVRKDGRPHLAPIWFVLDSNKDNNNNNNKVLFSLLSMSLSKAKTCYEIHE